MVTITIRFDGGCRPTNPGNKYGSYRVELNGKTVRHSSRIELGWGTNNEAEFESLVMALEWTRNELERNEFPLKEHQIEMFTDSQVVFKWISNPNRKVGSEPQQRMSRLANICVNFLIGFGGSCIYWNSRESNVKMFGH